jgi:hypothetical protein
VRGTQSEWGSTISGLLDNTVKPLTKHNFPIVNIAT